MFFAFPIKVGKSLVSTCRTRYYTKLYILRDPLYAYVSTTYSMCDSVWYESVWMDGSIECGRMNTRCEFILLWVCVLVRLGPLSRRYRYVSEVFLLFCAIDGIKAWQLNRFSHQLGILPGEDDCNGVSCYPNRRVFLIGKGHSWACFRNSLLIFTNENCQKQPLK